MKKLRVEEVIVVEGKYDAAKLADLVDGQKAGHYRFDGFR